MAVIRAVRAAVAGLSKRKIQNLYKRLRRQKRFAAADALRHAATKRPVGGWPPGAGEAMREPVTFTGRLGAR